MDDEAEAALLALGPVISWEKRGADKGWIVWRATHEGESKRYMLTALAPHNRDLGNGPKGTPCQWLLTVEEIASSSARDLWQMACVTAESAKAICERLVQTGDSTEVKALSSRFPLQWHKVLEAERPRALFCDASVALVYYNGRPVGR